MALDSLRLIVESDGPFACVEALFGNSRPANCRTSVSRMSGDLTAADRVRAGGQERRASGADDEGGMLR
jgi:hypothetical protein